MKELYRTPKRRYRVESVLRVRDENADEWVLLMHGADTSPSLTCRNRLFSDLAAFAPFTVVTA